MKFDGYRLLTFFEKGKVRLHTSNGDDWPHKFHALPKALAQLPIDYGILDGEVVALDAKGRPNFQQLQNLLERRENNEIAYYLFDLPHLAGYSLTQTPLNERKQLLAKLVSRHVDDDSII